MDRFSIRKARKDKPDVAFIINCFDSNLAFLKSIGSGSQWGTIPFSQRGAFVWTMNEAVQASTYSESGKSNIDNFNVLIAERRSSQTENGGIIPCGAAVLSSRVPAYIDNKKEQMRNITESGNFIYLHHLIISRDPRESSKGAGEALLNHIKKQARKNHTEAILVDCWSGNDGTLVRYYESRGFTKIHDFNVMSKHEKDVSWPGTLLFLKLYDETE